MAYVLAARAGEAALVVGVAERGHHLALHVLAARRAPRAERALVVLETGDVHDQGLTFIQLSRSGIVFDRWHIISLKTKFANQHRVSLIVVEYRGMKIFMNRKKENGLSDLNYSEVPQHSCKQNI